MGGGTRHAANTPPSPPRPSSIGAGRTNVAGSVSPPRHSQPARPAATTGGQGCSGRATRSPSPTASVSSLGDRPKSRSNSLSRSSSSASRWTGTSAVAAAPAAPSRLTVGAPPPRAGRLSVAFSTAGGGGYLGCGAGGSRGSSASRPGSRTPSRTNGSPSLAASMGKLRPEPREEELSLEAAQVLRDAEELQAKLAAMPDALRRQIVQHSAGLRGLLEDAQLSIGAP